MSYNRPIENCSAMTSMSHNNPPPTEGTTLRDYLWIAEYAGKDDTKVMKKSISNILSAEIRQINFQFIDDLNSTFALKSIYCTTNRPTVQKKTRYTKSFENRKRRPRNAFIIYRTARQGTQQFKGMTQTERSRRISACWQNERPETRARFERNAELEKGKCLRLSLLTQSSEFGYGANKIFDAGTESYESEWKSEGGINRVRDTQSDVVPYLDNADYFESSQYSSLLNYQLPASTATSLKSHSAEGATFAPLSIQSSEFHYGLQEEIVGSHFLYSNCTSQLYSYQDPSCDKIPYTNESNTFNWNQYPPLVSFSNNQRSDSNPTALTCLQDGGTGKYFPSSMQSSNLQYCKMEQSDGSCFDFSSGLPFYQSTIHPPYEIVSGSYGEI